MQEFTGFEYLMIDAANSFGLDKELYEDRIKWVEDHFEELEELADEAESKPLYMKAVQAIRKAQQGIPTGHLVGFDAVNSGMQIMSTLIGCLDGALATGLINPNERADAYTKCMELMRHWLPTLAAEERKKIKNAVMTVLYGSVKEPEKLFGKGSQELDVFYKAMWKLSPGSMQLLEVLRDTWDENALEHSWKLPDGFDVKSKVMVKRKERVEVDELGGATFTYEYYENAPKERGVSNVANVIHSVDAYLLRTLERRCNYDRAMVEKVYDLCIAELIIRANSVPRIGRRNQKISYYIEQYKRSTVADITLLPHLTAENIFQLSTYHIESLVGILEDMLKYEPFAVITVHDEFKCHPNNMNYLRQQYINILAELADSDLLADLLSQLRGSPQSVVKLSNNLSSLIRKSNYAIC
jgi:hypothetical protein